MRNPDGTGLFVGDVGDGLVDGPESIDGRSLAEGVVAAGLLVGPDSTDGIGLIEGDVRTGLEDGSEESEGLGLVVGCEDSEVGLCVLKFVGSSLGMVVILLVGFLVFAPGGVGLLDGRVSDGIGLVDGLSVADSFPTARKTASPEFISHTQFRNAISPAFPLYKMEAFRASRNVIPNI